MKVILHSDLNNFYASCEQVYDSSLKDRVFCVTGSVKDRHGIVLAKNEKAKKLGVKTGMTIRDAKNLCPELLTVEADFDKYLDFSEKVRKIYLGYTDRVEPFGIDEAWLDVTNSKIFGNGEKIADEIRSKVRDLKLTASVGVSFNKVFAKLGSDMKKPDATTVIDENNYKEKVWCLPCSDLLMVGRKTALKLAKFNINTIGDLANTNVGFLTESFGKWGKMLSAFAKGEDASSVRKYEEPDEIKSVGNSMTCYRDLNDFDDVHIMLSVLSDSVSSRILRKNLGMANTVTLTVRDDALCFFTRQAKLPFPSSFSEDILDLSMKLFKENYDFKRGVRSLGISASDFSSGETQLSIFEDPVVYDKKLSLAKTVGAIRDKYGSSSLKKAITLKDKRISREDPEETHVIHPESYKR